MNDFPRYDSYKDSGIDWLGEIPAHWNLLRGNYVFKVINDRSKKGAETLLTVSQDGIKLRSDSNVTMFMAESYEGYKLCYPGDLVINSLWAWGRGLGISKYEGIVSTAYSVYRPDHSNYDKDYLNYLLRTENYVSQYLIASRGIWISRLLLSDWAFLRLPILSPPKEEQTAIAEFLNRKTAQIEQAIAQKEQLIELLKERRQILIHKAVTHGLNPNVKLKHSGVDWIGEIPEHWEFEPIKHSLFGIVDCEHKTAPFVDEEGFFVVRTSNVKEGKLIFTDAKYTSEKGFIEWTKRGIPEPGDIILTREAPAGEACIVPNKIKLCLGQRTVWLKINKKRLLPEMAIYFIYSKLGRTYIDFLSAGSTVLHFNMSDIKNIPIISMPIEEQAGIVQYLKGQSAKIETAISCKQKEIEKLKEYKAVLINSAVTGKIKVCGNSQNAEVKSNYAKSNE